MKLKSPQIFPFLILCIIYFSILITPAVGQLLNKQEFETQLLQALDEKDTDRIASLFQAQRVDAIKLIESLLDSAIFQTARGEIKVNEGTWSTAKELSDFYLDQFSNDFFIKKIERYSHFSSPAIKKKAAIISQRQEGRESLLKGNFQAALELLLQTLEIAKSIDDVDGEAAILGYIGVAHFYLGDFDAALEHYQNSLALHEKLGDRRQIGNRLGQIANVYSDRSDYPTALAYFDQALEIRKEIDDKRGMAADYNNTGLVYYEMGDYNQALERYQKALELNRAIDNKRSVGKNLANIANIHISLGNYPQAIQTYSEALPIRRELGDRKGEGNDLGNLGIVYLNLGEYTKASSHFQQALSIHRELGYREGEAYQLGRIADLYGLKGDYVEAIRFYQKALQIHHDIGHARGEAYWLEAIGQTYFAVGDYERALDNLQTALDLHKSINDLPGEAATLNDMGRTYLEIDQVQKAKQYFDQALEMHRSLGEQAGECHVLGNLGYTHSLSGDSVSAVDNWNQAIHLADKIGERRLQGWLQRQLGDFYRQHNETEKAAKAYEQGLAITEGLEDLDLRWELYFGQGRLREHHGDYERAYYSYRAAINDIESIRAKSSIEEFKSGIMHNRFEAYEAIINVLLQMGRLQEAFEYSERARARSLLDQIGNGAIDPGDVGSQEIIAKERALRAKIEALRSLLSEEEIAARFRDTTQDNFRDNLRKAQEEYQGVLIDLKLQNPEYSSLVTVEPFPASEIQQLLNEECVLLEYFVSDDQTRVFVLSKDTLNVLTVPEGKNSLRGKIKLFQGTAVENIDDTKLSESHWIKPLHGLYNILIEPVLKKGLLNDKKHLIIVPQGLLHYVPFHALVSQIEDSYKNSIQPHYLIEDYFISYTPSASVLKYCREKTSGHISKMLLLAPKIDALPFSKQEVTQISRMFKDESEYRLGENASETLVKQKSKDYGRLHFATTAHFNKSNPLFSRLDLAPSEHDDGKLDVYETFALDLNANLVTLSACQTALGSGYTALLPQGDDFVSLTRAFLYAGTPSVVASLWEVYDTSTASFMHRFYQYLQTTNKVEALAQTQRDMISGNLAADKTYTHPYFWAPFVLIGDWKK